MLFNSYSFIFVFLPIVWVAFFIIGRIRIQFAAAWFTVASLLFYAWWNWKFLFLLIISIVFNFLMSHALAREVGVEIKQDFEWRIYFAVGFNLLLLFYFKYINFLIIVGNQMLGLDTHLLDIVLPIGISFYTFTQLTYLVDVYAGYPKEKNFIHYVLFVTYFPHLIAGPILHHKEMMPQFHNSANYQPKVQAIAVGLTVFMLGLFKKTVLADSVGSFADISFSAAQLHPITLLEAWGGALAYTMQIYFDFSAYTDMAIGISCAFNIKLPVNFESPYKSTSIIEFWRRWHITLSRFLRDYLYIPLGGNRNGIVKRYGNLLLTMLLGGLWHGAGLTFLVWGILHGIYLIVNHNWRALCRSWKGQSSFITRVASWLLTFLAVVVAWVFFRADSLTTAITILKAMAGMSDIVLPVGWAHVLSSDAPIWDTLHISFGEMSAFGDTKQLLQIGFLMFIALALPNVRQIFGRENIVLVDAKTNFTQNQSHSFSFLQWRPNFLWGSFVLILFLFSLAKMTNVSQFLYFQF